MRLELDHHNAPPPKCKNRSRLTPVQRKRPHEKRRCDQALTSHTLRTCKNRSRLTPVQRKRSRDITQVQKAQSPSTGNAYKTCVKPMILMIFKGRLITIGGARFEAKCLWADTLSQGNRCQKLKTSTRDFSRLWAKGPANL